MREALFNPYFIFVRIKQRGPTIKFVVSHPANSQPSQTERCKNVLYIALSDIVISCYIGRVAVGRPFTHCYTLFLIYRVAGA